LRTTKKVSSKLIAIFIRSYEQLELDDKEIQLLSTLWL